MRYVLYIWAIRYTAIPIGSKTGAPVIIKNRMIPATGRWWRIKVWKNALTGVVYPIDVWEK
jgi:hypothetical protein